jgi:anaerobic selenocysteine-containing dehydrogenase
VLGADHGGDRYTMVDQPGRGPVSASRAADRWVRTTCGYCSVGCGMLVGVREGRAVAVQGDPEHPVNRGRLCPKGLCEHQMIHADGRLTQSTVAGSPTTWDHAIDHVVTKFQRIIAEHGPGSVAVLSTGQLVTEEFYALGKLVRLGMGLTHYDGNTTLCMASAVAGYKMSFGTDGPPGCYDDLEQADVVVLWGANVADNHPLLVPRILGRDQTVVVVDPRVTKTAMIADRHLPVRPRGDVALLNGLLRALLDRGHIDVPAVRDHVDGLDELLAHLDAWTVERAADESGIDVDAINDTADVIGNAERCVFAWTMGVNHSAQGTETVTLLNSLAVLTGNIGRPGTGRSRSPGSATRWERAKPVSPRRCRATAPTTIRRHEPTSPRCGRSTRIACRASAVVPTPTSSTPSCRDGAKVCGSSPRTRSCRSPTVARSNTRSRSSICSSSKTVSRHRRRRSPMSFCLPPSGVRRRARSRTQASR